MIFIVDKLYLFWGNTDNYVHNTFSASFFVQMNISIEGFVEFNGLFFGFVKQIENVHKNIIHRRQNLSSFFLPQYVWDEVCIQIRTRVAFLLQKQTLLSCVLSLH